MNYVKLIADIRNKLQAPKTALELISQGKNAPKEFLEIAFGNECKIMNSSVKV